MNQTQTNNFSMLLRFPAQVISYLFHPLFIPTYILLFLTYQFPYEFAGIDVHHLQLRVFSVFWMTAFFPAFAVLLLWRLKFIESILLKTQKERIIPFVITMFFYWWMYYLSRNFKDQPEALKFFYFGIFISTALGLIINNFIKISLHAIAAGGAVAAVILFSVFYQTPLGIAIGVTTVLAGLICTCRLIVSNHTTQEIYTGLFVGIICQLIGYWFAM